MNPVEEYNRLLAANPADACEQMEWFEAAFVEAGINYAGAPMATFLRPHLVWRQDWNRLRDEGRRLLDLAARVARHAFGGDVGHLCSYLGLPEAHARWIRPDPGEPDMVLSRLDAFLTSEGPRFIEINSDAAAGFGYGDRMAEVFYDLPAFRRFAALFPVSYQPSGPALVESILGLWKRRGGAGLPSVAIVDFKEVKTLPDQEILRWVFRSKGVPCSLADPRELELWNGRLRLSGEAVDVVYRRGVLSELVERESELGAFFGAYRDGLALFVNSFRCQLSEDKAFLALLSDERFSALLSEAERAFVDRCVPWTRKLEERTTSWRGREIDLVPQLISQRGELILKPAHGYGGRSVFVGSETAPSRWEQAIREGLGEAWVAQERVTIPEEEFPVCDGGGLSFASLKVNTNPFYVAGAEVGAVTRASRSSVINVSAGGGSIPTFVLG